MRPSICNVYTFKVYVDHYKSSVDDKGES